MFGNSKFLMIWTNGNFYLLGFSYSTISHKIWKSSLKWIYILNPIFFSYMHRYTPILMWNPQLYKSPAMNLVTVVVKNHRIYGFLACHQTCSKCCTAIWGPPFINAAPLILFLSNDPAACLILHSLNLQVLLVWVSRRFTAKMTLNFKAIK